MKVILILICGAVLLSAVADGETTFACDRSALSTADRKRHFDELGPEVRGMVKSVRELNDGYEFEFSSDPATVRLAAEWAAGERLCCPFFDIELRLRNKGALEMRLSGPTGVKQFIEADFGQWISGATPNAARVLDAWIGIVEKQVLACAGAMTEDGFEFAPNDFAPDKGEFHGVRTFGDQIRHIAASNYQLGAQIIGEKPPHGEHGEQAPESVRSRAETLEYLQGSFAYLHQAMGGISDSTLTEPIPGTRGTWQRTRLGLALDAVAHSYDHYGQMVEYLRMNGIVPPASR